MNRWFIAIRKKTQQSFDLSKLTILNAPEGRYWADPFLAEDGDKTYLFFEDYDYVKGKLSVGEIVEKDGDIGITNVRTVLEKPYHMSFPSVINIEGEWFMTPEQVLSGRLEIYKAIQFPDVWEDICTVARGRYDDPIMRKVHGSFEVWASEDGDKLRVFVSDTLTDEWRLKTARDLEHTRNAGHFFESYRPVQESLPVYGRSIKFRRSDHSLSPVNIEPTWYNGLTGTHTFNVSSKYVVIDGRINLDDTKVDKN